VSVADFAVDRDSGSQAGGAASVMFPSAEIEKAGLYATSQTKPSGSEK
jgi:hypothetical protein